MSKKLFHSALGLQLKTARKKAGLIQAELAAKTGCTLPTVRQAEKGSGLFTGFVALAEALEHDIAGCSLPRGDTIGESLALLRQRQKLSYRRLASLTDTSPPTIAAIEAGRLGNLSPVERIAASLGAGLFLHPKGQKLKFYRTTATSSAFQAWTTPPELLNKLYSVMGGGFDLDPCSPTTDRNKAPVKARVYFTGETTESNGLLQPWFGSVFVNPPYGREQKHWIKKCFEEAQTGRASVIIALIPARPDTAAWHTWIAGQADVFLLRGRLKFLANDGSGEAAPFPSALIVWNAKQIIEAMRAAFPDAWHVPH